MTEENTEKNPSEGKRLVREIRDALESVRSLFVAAVALVITVAEMRPKPDRSSALGPYEGDGARTESEKSLSTFLEQQNNDDDSEPVEVSVEINKALSTKEFLSTFTYPFFAAVSTLSLFVGVVRLGPIAQWAETQNDCIETMSKVDGVSVKGLPDKVMTCNGGHSN